MKDQAHRSGALVALWTAAGMLILSYLVWFGLNAGSRLARPVEFVYGESIVLAAARRVAQGEPLYPPPDSLPLTVTAYTPLYYLLVAALQQPFGDGYTPGRVVSLVATLAAAALLVWSVQRVAGSWAGGLLAGGLFLTLNMTALLWAPLHRVDPLALCFSLCGLALATAGRHHAAAVPLLLAVLTKQTYLVAPIAVCLTLWPHPRPALGFVGLFGSGLVIAVIAAQVLSDGWFLWHTVLANASAYDPVYLKSTLGQFLHFNGLPLLAAAALFSLRPCPGERLWRLYFLGTLLMLPSIGKVGASSNYWLELTAASSALIGLLASRLPTRPGRRAATTDLGLAMMLVGALLVAVPGYQALSHDLRRVLPAGGGRAVHAQIQLAPLLAAEPGDVLTDEPALAIAAGKPVVFEFVVFQLLADQHVWDERPILEAIAARRFALVVLGSPLDAPPEQANGSAAVREALRASYEPAGQREGYSFYRPHPPAPQDMPVGSSP
jgi:hypothetical protein